MERSQTHSPSTPQTPPYSATSCGGGSDHSVFAPVFIGGNQYGAGPSPTTPIHSTPPTPPAWASMSNVGYPVSATSGIPPSTPPPLPPRASKPFPRSSHSVSGDLSSPRSRFPPTYGSYGLANTYEDQSPPPLPPRCQTFSTLPRNSSHALAGGPTPMAGHHVVQRLNSEITLPRRNSALDLPIAQPQLPRRFSQSGGHHHQSHHVNGPLSPPAVGGPPPNSTSVFLPSVAGPQLPPRTYQVKTTLNQIAR